MNSGGSPSKTPPLRKAAVLLLALGDEYSAALLKQMPAGMVTRLGAEMARIGIVDAEEVASALEEFQRVVAANAGTRYGGAQPTRKLLTSAFGNEEGDKLFRKVASTGPPALAIPLIQTVQESDPVQLARFLVDEHPQTIAVLLAQVKPEYASAVFAALPEAVRSEVALRVSRLESVSSEVIETVAASVVRKVGASGAVHRRQQHGVRTMADLLNRLDPKLSEEVLARLQTENETVAESVRQLLFIFEDLSLLDETAIRELISRVDRKLLATALKGTSADLQKYLLSSMSQRGADMFREDMEALGPVRVKDVQDAQNQIISILRQMETEGTVSLRGGGESQYVV